MVESSESSKRCSKCGEEKPLGAFYKNHRAGDKLDHRCKPCLQQVATASIRGLKLRVTNAYGGECACCGARGRPFLAVDHINENGAEERRQLAGGNSGNGSDRVYRKLDKALPKLLAGYQILCHSCNSAKHHNAGRCPHEDLDDSKILQQIRTLRDNNTWSAA